MSRRADAGSATILVVAAAMAVGLVAFLGVSVGAAALTRHRAAAAADLAALAGAIPVLQGAGPACAAARRSASANAATLSECRVTDGRVLVVVRVPGPDWLPLPLAARARAIAGPVADISEDTHPSRAPT